MKQKQTGEIRRLSQKLHPEVYHWDPETDGALTAVRLSDKLCSMGYECTRYTYSSGTCFPEHTHPVDKIDAVLDGRFLIRIYGIDVVLGAGDWVVIPRNTIHSAEVIGDQDVLNIDAVKLD